MGIILDNVSYTYQEGTPFASAALSDVSLTIGMALILRLLGIQEAESLQSFNF